MTMDLQELVPPDRFAPGVQRQLILETWQRRQLQKKRDAKVARARSSAGLLDYIELTKANYQAGWFHRKLCALMQLFLEAVIAGKRPRYMISAPPQHGKSEIVSRKFPCWAHGLHPELRFICSSYASTWAESLSADRLKNFDQAEYAEIFPDLRLRIRRADYLENNKDGFMLAAGVDQGITGRPSDIGLIDDPFKGYKEATSESRREALRNWFRTDFYSRLQQGAGVLLMNTRWHEDDLHGWLQEEAKAGGEQWQIFNFPAIAEEEEEFRREGDPLTVERYNLEALEAIRRVQGSYAWNALYQGHPAPPEGLMLQRDYWRYYDKRPDGVWNLPNFDTIVVSLDAAFKSTADSDHVALHVWGFTGPRGYLLDRTCERMGYIATKAESRRLVRKWNAHTLLIEDAANGPAAIEELRKAENMCNVIAISPNGGKVARAWPLSADLEAGNVWIPEGAEWSDEIVHFAAKFPNSPMDHDIDAMSQVFNWRRENSYGLFAYMEAEARKTTAMGMSELKSQVQNTALGLNKVETAPQTPNCPECHSVAIRKMQDGEMRCNQCGRQWMPGVNAEDSKPQDLTGGRADLLKG